MMERKQLIKNKIAKTKKSKKPVHTTNSIVFWFGILLSSAIFTLVITQYYLYDETLAHHEDALQHDRLNNLELALNPFSGDTFDVSNIFGKPFWGTLNSGHYFGLKLASNEPIETSLMWFKHEINKEGKVDIRHLCNQYDNIRYYAWEKHDFHNFGLQVIEDSGYLIKTKFLKNPDNQLEWQAILDIEPHEEDNVIESNKNKKLNPISVIQYITTNNPKDVLDIDDSSAGDKILTVQGVSQDIGHFIFEIEQSSGDKLLSSKLLRTTYNRNDMPISDYIMGHLDLNYANGTLLVELQKSPRYRSRMAELNSNKKKNSNFMALQLNIQGKCKIKINMRQAHSDSDFFKSAKNELYLSDQIQSFDHKFHETFPFANMGIQPRNQLSKMYQIALSNMLGSVGHFYGQSYIANNPDSNKIKPYGPLALLSGVPSRSFFPRGFLWDEAFHNILISHWDPSLSNKIIKSWFNLMNSNGWIPREVILGIESMRRVPREFLVQYISNANPPAMFLTLDLMIKKNTLNQETFDHIYPRLKSWYNWFNISQHGPKPYTYRWRGRDRLSVKMLNPKTLASGLDDYPRASHPSPQEYHLDLRCWMAMALRTFKKFALKKGDQSFLDQMKPELDILTDQKLLDNLHWSEEHKMYCDFGHNTQRVDLVKVRKTRQNPYGYGEETYEEFERQSSGHPEFGCVPEFGYVSLFPMIFNLIEPESKKLNILLDRLRDPNELWSPYGVRSLSKKSLYYNKYNTEHDRPYWRGPVWLNLNYLILSGLHQYSKHGPYAEKALRISEELRHNLVVNVFNEFNRTNYIWEHYNDQTGRGQGSHPFSGWSSLILLIGSMNAFEI